ncbi:MAG: hypothetical protein GWP47_16890 [Actinobacteria bacterium]|jgi:hypothetical protein|nr:hypothetical protein [Actinomycetota bacterium]NCG35906.1 hypothetical protein [Actinomycetota bacterium]
MRSSPLTRPWLTTIVIGFSLLASACGDTAETGQASVATSDDVRDIEVLSVDDVRDIEVLSVDDGSVSSLRDAVTGDRPVLLWFWAPH